MKKSIIAATLAILAFNFISTGHAKAETIIGDERTSEQVAYILDGFDREQGASNLWYYGWIGIYSGIMGYYTYSALTDKEHWVSSAVTASKSSIALALLFARPFKPVFASAQINGLPDTTREERSEKLEYAELMLQASARQEIVGRSLTQHLIVLMLHLVGAGIVWNNEGLDRAFISALPGLITSGLFIWTQPMAAQSQQKAYQSKYKSNDQAGQPEYYWALFPTGVIEVGVKF